MSIKTKYICQSCSKNESIRSFIQNNRTKEQCHYCGESGFAAPITTVFDHILCLIDDNFASNDDLTHYEQVMIYDCGSDNIPIYEIDEIISENLNLDSEPYFDDLIKYIPTEYKKDGNGSTRHFFADDGYLENNIYDQLWEKFSLEINHSFRFFNANANKFLDSVFSCLTDENGNIQPIIIRTLLKGDKLYRARIVADIESAREISSAPATQLGPVPAYKASNQRMTPHGISALYCSLERETCLSEIRSITGDFVISGAFTPVSRLKLLDLRCIKELYVPHLTLFDFGCRRNKHLQVFIQSLVEKLSKPKRRDDEFSYLPTQFVFEYFRVKFNSTIDGLIFPSVQTGGAGTNIVLFPENSIVSTNLFKPDNSSTSLDDESDSFSFNEFKSTDKVAFFYKTIVYHQIRAIETKFVNFDDVYTPFLSKIDKKRIGIT